jgi:hypothetical protein
LSRELRSTPARLRETFANVSDLRLPAPTSEFVTRDSINQADGKAPSAPCFLTEARRNIKTKKVTFSVASEREVETDYETPAVSRSYTSNKL